MSYEYFEHKADIGIIGYGKTVSEAFEQAALAMFEIMVETADIIPIDSLEVEVQGNNLEELFMEWLSELIFLKDVEYKMFNRFEVKIINKNKLQAIIQGETIEPSRHKLKLEVKAATWTQLLVKKTADKWIAQCLVDV